VKIVTTADMFTVDKYLGHAASSATFGCHGGASSFITIDGMFLVSHLFAIQKLFRPDAKGARPPGVNLNAGSHNKASMVVFKS
jgi:hypothetical protein